MPNDSKQMQAFYVSDWLPDGDRILIVIASDATGSRSFSSIHHLCFYKSQQIRSFPQQVSFDPEQLPAEFRPTCADAIDEHLRQAKAQIDMAYAKKFAAHVGMCGAPSCRISDALTMARLSQLYMIGGFSQPLQNICGATKFSGLSNSLRPIVALPVIRDRRDDVITLTLP